MAKAIGEDAPGKSVQIPPGESYTVAEVEGAGTIVRIWMTIMQPIPGAIENFNQALVLRFYWDGEPTPTGENAAQFALFTSPVWVPAAWLGLKLLRRLFAPKRR